MFLDYLIAIINERANSFNNYRNISRKEFPKWEGWKLLEAYKANKTPINDIDDHKINVMVENFHHIQFLINKSRPAH